MPDLSSNQWNDYWLADDGRLFSTAKQEMVSAADDTGYADFLASGLDARTWPRDDGGQQTITALQDCLTPYGLYADLTVYAAAKRYAVETGGIAVSGVNVATDDRSKTLLIGTRIAAEADPTFTTPWVGTDGVSNTLTAPQIIGLSNAVLAHVQACFTTFDQVAAEIKAGTVTTMAEIDAAFAAI